jgi:transposase
LNHQELTLTMAQAQRYHVIQTAIERRMTNQQAADALRLSVRQVQRLKRKIQARGPAGIRHGNSGATPHNRLSDRRRQRIIHLAQTTYAGYNFSHLADALVQEQDIHVSDETLRRLLRPLGHGRKPRRLKVHRRRRQRRKREGELLFLDGSPHPWFGEDHPPVCLLLASDDATGNPLRGKFQPQEDRDGCFEVCYHLFRRFGLPVGFYLDRASQFIRTDHRAAREGRTIPPTAFQIAMETLAVGLTFAHSPQARGRAERLNGSFQDRLVAELVRHGINNCRDATRYLNRQFIPRYCRRFAQPPAEPTAAWRPLDPRIDLKTVLCRKANRCVANDNTVRYNGAVYQLQPLAPRRHLVHATIEVQHRFDGSIHFVHPTLGPLKAKSLSTPASRSDTTRPPQGVT